MNDEFLVHVRESLEELLNEAFDFPDRVIQRVVSIQKMQGNTLWRRIPGAFGNDSV